MVLHISMDLETWGTTPGSDIRSIGACVFDIDAGKEPCIEETFYIVCDNPVSMIQTQHDGRKYPLTRDPNTVQWWNDQSDEAQAAFADPVDLRECLVRFGEWLQRTSPEARIYNNTIWQPGTDIRLWSHGSHFDEPILAAAYRAVGLPVPWH